MTRMLQPSQAEVTSVAFVPWNAEAGAPRLRLPEPLADPLLTACLRRLQSAFEELASRVCAAGRAETGTVLLASGCQRGAGCSTVALALAAASAWQRPTLLIDGDLGRTGLSTRVGGKERTQGWETTASLERPTWKVSGGAGLLSFLPLSRPLAERDELFTRPALPEWLGGLRDCYRLIVVDGGPAPDTGARWAAWTDVAILVCDSARRATDDWATSWDRLEEAGTRVLGIVETFAGA